MKFLGTGAGEGTPNPFCSCRICEHARVVKGKEIRTRSSFLLSEQVVIDMGADYFAQSIWYDASFVQVEHVLYTHMHDDHINYTMLWERFAKRKGSPHPLHIYLVEDACRFFTDFYRTSPLTNGLECCLAEDNVKIVPLSFGKTVSVAGIAVTPLRAAHTTGFEKNGSNFLMEYGGKRLYYALDSGYFLEETFAQLAGKALDTLICECTFPVPGQHMADRQSGHMDLYQCLDTLHRLYQIGTVTPQTAVYLSHISPVGMTHAELEGYLCALELPYRIIAAYDGMQI